MSTGQPNAQHPPVTSPYPLSASPSLPASMDGHHLERDNSGSFHTALEMQSVKSIGSVSVATARTMSEANFVDAVESQTHLADAMESQKRAHPKWTLDAVAREVLRARANTVGRPYTLDKHWVEWPNHWEMIAHVYRPRGHFFYPTGVSVYDPASGAFHHWQSRANRKRTDHHRHTERRPSRPWWSYVVCWKPRSFAWWVALSFTVGSVMFVIVGIALLVPSLYNSPAAELAYGKLGLAGASLFAAGGTCQVLEVLQAPVEVQDPSHLTRIHHENLSAGSSSSGTNSPSARKPTTPNQTDAPIAPRHTAPQPNAALKQTDSGKIVEAPHPGGAGAPRSPPRGPPPKTGFDIMGDRRLPLSTRLKVVFWQWRRIDVMLAYIQWVGVILFVINSVGTVGWWESTIDPDVSEGLFLGITIVPDVTASCTFVIAGWLQVVEATHSWWGGIHFGNVGWLAGIFNTLGGLGFLANALCWYYLQGTVTTTLVLLIGSVFFLIGSAIQWLEQCW